MSCLSLRSIILIGRSSRLCSVVFLLWRVLKVLVLRLEVGM